MKTFKRINDGIDRPVPKEGFGRYIRLLGMHFWKLVWISAMLLVLSIPVVTIPAALCAANRVCIKLIREGNVFPWHEFWKEFKAELFRALLPGLLFAVIIAAAYYFMSLGLSNSDLPLWSVIFWTVGIVAAYLGFTWGTYTFSLILAQYLKYYGVDVWVKGYVILLRRNSPVDSELVLDSLADVDRALHTPDRTRLDKKTVEKIVELLL